MYALSPRGAQHGAGGKFTGASARCSPIRIPTPRRRCCRAAQLGSRWHEPPASRYPTFAAKTLLPDVDVRFSENSRREITMYNPRTVSTAAHYNVADLSGVMASRQSPHASYPF
jgi:hypothetical protein